MMIDEYERIKNQELTNKIFFWMILGFIVGILLKHFGGYVFFLSSMIDILTMVGQSYIRLLKLIVVPLVFFSLVTGIISIGSLKQLGRIGIKSFVFYMFTTMMASTLALGIAIFMSRFLPPIHNTYEHLKEAKSAPSLIELTNTIIPESFVQAFSGEHMLQVIFISIFFAIALLSLKDNIKSLSDGMELINKAILKMVYIIMLISPYAVFALMVTTAYEIDGSKMQNVAGYVFVLVLSLSIHLFGTLLFLFKYMTKLSPKIFLTKMRDAQLFAFSTASSNATMPVTYETLIKRLGVDKSIASFTVPFGATINMDGTAIMQGVAAVFIAQMYDIPLEITDYMIIMGMSILASIGTAGVPGVGLIMLTMVFVQVNIPTEGIAILLAVDRLMDMMRTAVNISGDAVVTCIIATQENKMDKQVYNSMTIGVPEQELSNLNKYDTIRRIQQGKYETIIHEDGRIEYIPSKE